MRIITGKVISKRMQKTATVLVERTRAHPIYRKRIKLNKKYKVHDELNSEVGDMVNFVESRAYSKTKKWKVIEVVGKKQKKVDVDKSQKDEIKIKVVKRIKK